MLRSSYFGLLFAFGLLAVTHAATLLSSSGGVDSSYVIDTSQVPVPQVIYPVKIYMTTYHHKATQKCVKVVNIRLITTVGDDFLTDFLVSCDTPLTPGTDRFNIGDVVHVMVVKNSVGGGVWAVFVLDGDNCLQRRYTDDKWRQLKLKEETMLSVDQCRKVLKDGRLVVAKGGSTVPQPKAGGSAPIAYLPELGSNVKGKTISLEHIPSDHYLHYVIEDSKGVVGAVVKVTAIKQKKKETGECMTVIYIEEAATENDLDSAQFSCVDLGAFTRAKDMISFGGLVYIRDKVGDATWAVFVMDNHCVLRTYMNARQELVEVEDRTLTWDQCKQVVATQGINWLPKIAVGSELGSITQLKLTTLEDICTDHYHYTVQENQEISVDVAKVSTYRLKHMGTKECVIQVYIDSIESGAPRDFLDCLRVNCVRYAHLVTDDGLIIFGDRIYVRAQRGEPIWAVFVLDEVCVLRKYTDTRRQLLGKQDRVLTWDQCKDVVPSMAGALPDLVRHLQSDIESHVQSALELSDNLADIREIINKQPPMSQQPIRAPTGYQPIQSGSLNTPKPTSYQPVNPKQGRKIWSFWP